jgi:hypothetical protein
MLCWGSTHVQSGKTEAGDHTVDIDLNRSNIAAYQWLTPVILDTQEAEKYLYWTHLLNIIHQVHQ